MVNVNFHSQGDAHLLLDGSVVVLIDAGEKYAADQALIPYLSKKKIDRIDHFFISHPHTDHYGGLESLLDSGILVDNIYYNLPPEGMDDWNYKLGDFLALIMRASNLGSTVRDIGVGFKVELASSNIEVLYAQEGSTLKNGRQVSINDYSLILQWDAGGFRTLFTGDLNEPLGTELATEPHYKADILKVPHHGVTGIAPNTFFDVVNPKLNMFPSTAALWNHPRGDRVKRWTIESNIYYCNNGLNGNVVLQLYRSKVIAVSDNPSSGCPNAELDITPGDKVNERPNQFPFGALELLLIE